MTTESPEATKPPEIRVALAEKRRSPEAVLDYFGEGADLIVGLGNGEPVTELDAIEANAKRFSGVSVHQMFPLRERRYMHGVYPGLRHVSWFLSPANREAFHKGACDLVPNNFSDVPRLMQHSTPPRHPTVTATPRWVPTPSTRQP
jgi:hypothetical protein